MNIKTCKLCQNLNDGWCASQNKRIIDVMPYEICGFRGTWERPRQVVVATALNRVYVGR